MSSSFYKQYTGKTAGRVLHFIYHYCGYDASERAQVSDNKVFIFNRPIATFKWLFPKREEWTATSPKKQLERVLDGLTQLVGDNAQAIRLVEEAKELSEFCQTDWSMADIPEFDFLLPELNDNQKLKQKLAIADINEDKLSDLEIILK